AAWVGRGAGAARAGPPGASRRAEANAPEQPPSAAKPAIMIQGLRASVGASPLICTPTAECPVCSRDAAIQAPVKATGPAIPAIARILKSRIPNASGRARARPERGPPVTDRAPCSLGRVRVVSTG